MDNFTVRDERNFHNLVAKPNRMHLLDKPNGYASAMVKSCLAHQMRFTVQKLEEELCAGGDPHVLQTKLSGTIRASRLAGSSLPTAHASRTVQENLPVNASTREPRYS